MLEKNKISVLVIVKDEEEHLHDCLESVKWANEIVVVDSGSTDKTIEIAKKFSKKVFYHKWPGFSKQKNWGAQKCSNNWILSIDADERIPEPLKEEILTSVKNSKFVAYNLPEREFMFGKWIYHGQWYPQYHIRLYRKDKGTWGKNVHESFSSNGEVGNFHNPIYHYGHTSIYEFVEKLNTYTEAESLNRFEAEIKINLWSSALESIKIFRRKYWLNQGYKDGGHGFILASLMAFYQFLNDIKVWELRYKKEHGSS